MSKEHIYDDLSLKQGVEDDGKASHKLEIKRQDGVDLTVPITPALAQRVKKISESKGPQVLTEDNPDVHAMKRNLSQSL